MTAEHPAGEEKTVMLSARIPEDLMAELNMMCQGERRNRTQQLTRILEDAVTAYKKKRRK